MKFIKKMLKGFLITVFVISSGISAPEVHSQSICTLESGDMFTVEGVSTVYIINNNGERLFFPNSEVYHTWNEDFSNVINLDPTCVDSYPVPSIAPFSVLYRAGSRLVTTPLTSKVYAVMPGGDIAPFENEQAAEGLYGADWASLVRDIPEVYWHEYHIRLAINDSTQPVEGMLVSTKDGLYLFEDGLLKEIALNDLFDFMEDDIREFEDGLLDEFMIIDHDGGDLYDIDLEPGIIQDNVYSLPEPTPITIIQPVEDKPIIEYSYRRVDSTGGLFSLEQPDHWDIADEDDIGGILNEFALGSSSSDGEFVDFIGFSNTSIETSATAMVLVQDIDNDVSGVREFINNMINPDPEVEDALAFLNQLGIEFQHGDLIATSLDGEFALDLKISIVAESEEILRMEFIEYENEELVYFVVFMTLGEDLDRYNSVYNRIQDSFEFKP